MQILSGNELERITHEITTEEQTSAIAANQRHRK